MKVCHLTSAHPRYDTRIFLKECRSLSRAGHKVTLVVADGGKHETIEGVEILSVPRANGRLGRMFLSAHRVYKAAHAVAADVYHFHDPELLPYGFLLACLGNKVVFDAHEDFPKQLRSKFYLPNWVRLSLSWFFAWFEAFVCRRLVGVIAATPVIAQKFARFSDNVETINNYPMLGELSSPEVTWEVKRPWVAYVGGIAAARGIEEVIKSMECVPDEVRLRLCGRFNNEVLAARCQSMPGWKRVDELGFVDREGVKDVLACSFAGLVTFHSCPNHVDAQPNKMFEYMSAGVPVIASNFDLWREVIEGNECGVCVDPRSPAEIAKAIESLFENPEMAERMGRNGQAAVQKLYNWDQEKAKLLDFYEGIGIEA